MLGDVKINGSNQTLSCNVIIKNGRLKSASKNPVIKNKPKSSQESQLFAK